MSSLISTRDMLRLVAQGKKPPTSLLHATGVDLEILQEVAADIKPELNFFSAGIFDNLRSIFIKDSHSPWAEWYEAAGVPVVKRPVLMLAFLRIVDERGLHVRVPVPDGYTRSTFQHGYLQVYLTKAGRWIVWTNNPKSNFAVFDDPTKAVKHAYKMLGEGQFLGMEGMASRYPQPRPVPRHEGNDYDRKFVASLAMELVAALQEPFKTHIALRERRLGETKGRLSFIEEQLDNFEI